MEEGNVFRGVSARVCQVDRLASRAFARKPHPLGCGVPTSRDSAPTKIWAKASAGFAFCRTGSLPTSRDGEASLGELEVFGVEGEGTSRQVPDNNPDNNRDRSGQAPPLRHIRNSYGFQARVAMEWAGMVVEAI